MDPPLNELNFERVLLALGDNTDEQRDEVLSPAQRLRRNISGMVNIRRGLTVDAGAAEGSTARRSMEPSSQMLDSNLFESWLLMARGQR